MAITQEQIREAYESLKSQSIYPTVARIRGVLGTGSNSTIYKYLDELKKQDAAIESLNPEKHGAFDATESDLLRRLLVHTRERVEKELSEEMQSTLQKEILEREKEIAEMRELIHRLEAQLETSNAIQERLLQILEKSSNPEMQAAVIDIQQAMKAKSA